MTKSKNTKSKNTKRALLASVLSLILCVTMLIGSTFAWFTDSVTSGKNKIVAGNLDVELYAKSGEDYTPVTADTNLFMENTLWEPGHVEVINLKVANLGTLALQYKLGINVADERPGTNVAGESFKLSDHIKFALIEGEQTYTTREAALTAAEAATPVKLSELAVDKTGVLYPKGKGESESLVTLIIYMPTTVRNEANYLTGTEAPTVDLGIKLVATQTPYESDSFDDQYDASAWDTLMEEMNRLTVDFVPASEKSFDVASFDTVDSKLMQVWLADGSIGPETLFKNALTFTVTGRVSKAMRLTFDFDEKCGEGESYKDIVFSGGFGGYDDIYLPAGTYSYSNVAFELVGDYHPFIFTVTPGEGNQNKFSYKGSLPGLIAALSKGFTLEPGEYHDTFTVSVEWPFWSSGTDACYVKQNGVRVSDNFNDIPSGMDIADTHCGMTGGENWHMDLWADFEVVIKEST